MSRIFEVANVEVTACSYAGFTVEASKALCSDSLAHRLQPDHNARTRHQRTSYAVLVQYCTTYSSATIFGVANPRNGARQTDRIQLEELGIKANRTEITRNIRKSSPIHNQTEAAHATCNNKFHMSRHV